MPDEKIVAAELKVNQGSHMLTPFRIADVSENGEFSGIVKFCLIGLLLTLVFVIAVRLTLSEWLEFVPGE